LAAVQGKLKELEGGIEIELPESVLFDTGRATLRPEGKKLLDSVAAKIKQQYPNHKVTVEGHTDSRPVVVHKNTYPSNWELGSARALAVLHYLNDVAGLPKAYAATTYADNKPLASDATADGRQKNRRAMIVLRAKK
jgi:chemotaxis protein MotB